MSSFSRTGFLQAREYLQQSIARDANFAPAHATLSMCYSQLGFLSVVPRNEAAQQAREQASRALTLDEGLAEAHAASAYARLLFDWDWHGAEAEFRRALELNPNSADTHLLYSNHLTWSGRFDEAIRENQLAIEIDPLNPYVNFNLGWIYSIAKRPAEGIAFMQKLQQRNPHFPYAHHHLAFLYAEAGNCEAALGETTFDEGVDSAYTYALCGEHQKAERILRGAEREAAAGKLDPVYPAWIHATLGDREEAFRWLNRALDEHSVLVVFTKVAPELDDLRPDSRFAEVLRRAGIN